MIIRDEMSEQQKQRFIEHLTAAFRDFRPEDAAAIIALLMTNQAVVVTKIVQFLTSEMRLNIID